MAAKKKKIDNLPVTELHLTDLHPCGYNPRKISDEQYAALKKSMEEYGFVEPMLIDLKDDNAIIGGHQRFNVLLDEVIDEGREDKVYVIKLGNVGWAFTDLNLKVKDKNYQKGLNLALNKINGEWDVPKLKDIFDELEVLDYDLSYTGFNDLELHDVQFASTIKYKDDYTEDLESLYTPPVDKEPEIFKCPNCGNEETEDFFEI